MAGDDDVSARSGGDGDAANSPPSTPGSPTSVGFNTDQLPFNTSQNNYPDDDVDDGDGASVDPEIIRDDDQEDHVNQEEEEDGEDLFNDNFMEDYRRLEDQDQYEPLALDDSMEDERDLDQIMANRRAAELQLEAREAAAARHSTKLPHLFHDQASGPYGKATGNSALVSRCCLELHS